MYFEIKKDLFIIADKCIIILLHCYLFYWILMHPFMTYTIRNDKG